MTGDARSRQPKTEMEKGLWAGVEREDGKSDQRMKSWETNEILVDIYVSVG